MIVVATHPRSGTHLVLDFLRRQFPRVQPWLRPFASVHESYVNIDRLKPGVAPSLSAAQARRQLRASPRSLVKTHALPELHGFVGDGLVLARALLTAATVLNVVRNPRSVLGSAFAWYRANTGNEELRLGDYLRQTPHGIDRASYWAVHVAQWKAHGGGQTFRYEDIIEDPRRALARLEASLGMRAMWKEPLLPPNRPTSSIAEDYLRRLRRDYEVSAIKGLLPCDSRARWMDLAEPSDDRFLNSKAGKIARDLGYELTSLRGDNAS